MASDPSKIIYSIGHSNHEMKHFIDMLDSFAIKNLVDIRRFPGSRKHPHFNAENMKDELAEAGIDYIPLIELGGRRKASSDSKNTAWRNPQFRAYADYMETESFELAIKELETIASQKLSAYMCSEVLWWRCHRALVSDYLKNDGWTVLHITGIDKASEHQYTAPSQIINNKVCYYETKNSQE